MSICCSVPFCHCYSSQTTASTVCVATHTPCIIDSSASNHVTDTTSDLSDVSTYGHLPRVTLVDGSTTHIVGLGTASLSSSFS